MTFLVTDDVYNYISINSGSSALVLSAETIDITAVGVVGIAAAQISLGSLEGITIGGDSDLIAFYNGTPVTRGTITGDLTAVTDANAKAVLASIVNQLDRLNLILNGTT